MLKFQDVKHLLKNCGKVYSSTALPTTVSPNEVWWNNLDDQFTVTLLRGPHGGHLSGQYYDWDEAQEEWVDGVFMEDAELLQRLQAHEFVLPGV